MNSNKSKTFFTRLKETVGRIDRDFAEIKESLYSLPEDESATKKIFEIDAKVKLMGTEADELKTTVIQKLNDTRHFCNDFEELIIEVEENVLKHQKYMEKYGYKPLELISENGSSGTEIICSPSPSEDKYKDDQRTPDVFDYGIASSRHCNMEETLLNHDKTPEDNLPKVLDFDVEENLSTLESTPVLDINVTPEKNEINKSCVQDCHKVSDECPPTPILVLPTRLHAI